MSRIAIDRSKQLFLPKSPTFFATSYSKASLPVTWRPQRHVTERESAIIVSSYRTVHNILKLPIVPLNTPLTLPRDTEALSTSSSRGHYLPPTLFTTATQDE